jgi:hypothetical protein
MTDLVEAPMTMLEDEGSNGRRVLWMMVAGLGIVMTAGAIAGFMSEHQADGGGAFSGVAIGVLASFIAIIAGLTYLIWRNAKKLKASGEPMTSREKLNRNIIMVCGILGGVVGAGVAAAGLLNAPDRDVDPLSILVTGPMPVAVALSLVFVWGVIMPVLAWFWHTRAIDEQEAAAYRDGGYYAAYAYLILTPVWWLLWRGGIVCEPDGVAIFMAFAFIWSAVWFWKKYR